MRRFFRELRFDLKEPGINIRMIPLAAGLFLIMTYIVQSNLEQNNLITLSLLETLIPFLGGYGAMMLMQGLLDTEGGELNFTYPRSYLYWGLIRQLRFFILFAVLIAVVCGAVSMMMDIAFGQLFLLTLAQSFAVMAVSFLGVTSGKKVSIGLIVLIGFIGIQITLGREYALFNWIFVMSGAMPYPEQLTSITLNALGIGVFGWGVGQVLIRP